MIEFSDGGNGTIRPSLNIKIGIDLKPGEQIGRFNVSEHSGHDLDVIQQPEGTFIYKTTNFRVQLP